MRKNQEKFEYKRASEVTLELLYTTFTKGFSDYIVPAKITFEDFEKRFFSIDGNIREASFIALDNNEGVGIVFTGIRRINNIKTMRCGALSVAPEFRGTGVAQELLRLHLDEAIKYNVDNIMLEVIKGNNRAIKFYERQNYKARYNWVVYKSTEYQPFMWNGVEGVNYNLVREYFNNNINTHYSWSNSVETLTENNATVLGFIEDGIIKGIIAYNEKSIFTLHVIEKYRAQGIGKKLLQTMFYLSLNNKSFCLIENELLDKFLTSNMFEKNSLEQYEMYQ